MPSTIMSGASRRAFAGLTFGLAILCAAGPALSQQQQPTPAPTAAPMGGMHGKHGKPMAACTEPTLACATIVTPSFAPDGSLWVAFTANKQILVARSTDLGRSFGAPTAVTPEPVRLDGGADSRSRVLVDREGRVLVTYAIFKDEKYNGQVLFSRSTDGGRTFAPPRPITDDAESQRFQVTELLPNGRIFAAWFDKRARAAVRAAGREYSGAGLAFAWSDDGGASFSTSSISKEGTCECCRLGFAVTGSGQPVAMFRNIFEGMVRDHAIMTFANSTTPGPLHRVAVDNWELDVCPDHGPSLTIADDGSYHATWFTDGTVRHGLFYARSLDGGKTFSEPMGVGHADRGPSRPQVLAVSKTVWVAWKEFDGDLTTIRGMRSSDNGATWTEPKTLMQTLETSDHPILVSDGKRGYLSWQTQNEGYRLISLEDAS
jgi:hypothetical protein